MGKFAIIVFSLKPQMLAMTKILKNKCRNNMQNGEKSNLQFL